MIRISYCAIPKPCSVCGTVTPLQFDYGEGWLYACRTHRHKVFSRLLKLLPTPIERKVNDLAILEKNLVKGGQGKSAEEIQDSGIAGTVVLLAAILIAGIAVIAWLA